MTEDQSCATCQYWQESTHTERLLGACRRNPPQIIARFNLSANDAVKDPELIVTMSECSWESASESFTRFPTTLSDDWCGQWQPHALSGVKVRLEAVDASS